VTIADTTTGATIYYTTMERSDSQFTKYTGAISVSATETIEAIAIATGYNEQHCRDGSVHHHPTAATPTFSPPPARSLQRNR